MPKRPVRLLLAALEALLLAGFAQAGEEAFRTKFDREVQPGQRVVICKRIPAPPSIDGEVDQDPAWRACNRTQGAWTELGTRTPSGRQTVTYCGFDDENLYFGFVCEETDLGRVSMEGGLDQTDSVEVLLETGGLMGEGHVHGFRANLKPQKAGWQSAGKFGANRWMVEMAIPFSALKGLSKPRRGDVLGLKLARFGKTSQLGEERMVSTYNTQLPFKYLYLCGFNNLLYLEDDNVLGDGQFAGLPDKSAWKVEGPVRGDKQGVALAKGATLTQAVTLKPDSSYAVQLLAQGQGAVRVRVGKEEVKLDAQRAGSFWNSSPKPVEIVVEALADVVLRSAEVRFEPGIEPPGAWCLTNNYVKPERNIKAELGQAPDGRYRYVKLDYADRFEEQDAPIFREGVKLYRYDADLVIEDLGGNKDWIPFSKGSLTGRPEAAFWRTMSPNSNPGHARHAHVVLEVDLGQTYFVSGLDLHLPAPYILNMEVWGKVNEEDPWTFMYLADGDQVDPKKRYQLARRGSKTGVGFARIRELDSVVRHLRFRATTPRPYWPELDGVQEFWVWGEPPAGRQGIQPFQPYIAETKIAAVEGETWRPDRENVQLIPVPRRLEYADGRFVINPRTRIVCQDETVARTTARQIQEELRERWQFDLEVEAAPQAGSAENTIFLGQPALGGRAAAEADAAGFETPPAELGEQGYGLQVTPSGVRVLGRDGPGLYYGAQTFMQALRWYQASESGPSGPSARCMKALDWPGTVERGITTSNKPSSGMLKIPYSEWKRIKRQFQLFSRFKLNVVYLPAELTRQELTDWPDGALARLCREVREEYHLELRPDTLSGEIESAGWYQRMVSGADAWDVVEHDPDEGPRLGSSLNPCPLHPRTYELMFKRFDRILEEFDWPGAVWTHGQLYHGVNDGARWGVCRRCRQSGMSSGALYGYFLSRVSEHLKSRGARALIWDKKLSFGEVGRSDERLDALNLPNHVRLRLSEFVPKSGQAAEAWKYLEQSVAQADVDNGPPGWQSQERVAEGGGVSSQLLLQAHAMWHGPDVAPELKIDAAEYYAWMSSWLLRCDFPAWRQGATPRFHAFDLRPFVNHLSHPSGAEKLEGGRPPEFDLRHVPAGLRTLGGVDFEIIDPAANAGKAVLMLGRPGDNLHPKVAKSVSEAAGPIPVGRKLASLAFLRARWSAKNTSGGGNRYYAWLRPTCRVVYEDDSWLVADGFCFVSKNDWLASYNDTHDAGLVYRLGWQGNAPTAPKVVLSVLEWVNPYPERVIKQLEFFTPGFEDEKGARLNPWVEAFVAITGVEPIEQDVQFWSRAPRPPMLPAAAPRKPGLVECADGGGGRKSKGPYEGGTLKGPAGEAEYKIQFHKDSGYFAYGRFRGVYNGSDLTPFGATLTFQQPIALAAVELLGPVHMTDRHYFSDISGQYRKVDVTVEYTEDGESWKEAGTLRGISGEADFLPVALPDVPLKGVRLTGTPEPYRRRYMAGAHGGMLAVPFHCPLFGWRFLASGGGKE